MMKVLGMKMTDDGKKERERERAENYLDWTPVTCAKRQRQIYIKLV